MSSVYFHFFTDRLSFGVDWTEYLFLIYANHTLIQCAGLPTATFSMTQLCLREAAATIALTSDRSAGQLQLRRMEGSGRGGWLEREREG